MPYERTGDRRDGTHLPLASHSAVGPSRDVADPTTDAVGLAPVPGLLGGGTLLRTPGPGQTDTQDPNQDAADKAIKNAGRTLVTQARQHLDTATRAILDMIPLAHSPFTVGQAMPLLGQAQSHMSIVQNLLDEGLAMQGRIQRGAPPGGSIGPDGMPMNEGEWLQIRLKVKALSLQIAAATPQTAATLHPQLVQLSIEWQQAIAADQMRAVLARVPQPAS
jgi:hypothetical protein